MNAIDFPSSDRAGTAYAEWKGWREDEFNSADPGTHAYFAAELRACGLDLRQPRRVLEIGFGNGRFARFCQDSGWAYTGTELDPALIERGRRHGLPVHAATLAPSELVGTGATDLVVAFDVFEHIETDDLVALLADLRTTLAPGGRIVARFPNGDSPFCGPLYNGDMTHRTLLGIGKVHQISGAAGLRVVARHGQTTILRGLGPMRLARQSLAMLTRRLIGFVVASAYYGGGRVLFDQNMVVVLEPGR